MVAPEKKQGTGISYCHMFDSKDDQWSLIKFDTVILHETVCEPFEPSIVSVNSK